MRTEFNGVRERVAHEPRFVIQSIGNGLGGRLELVGQTGGKRVTVGLVFGLKVWGINHAQAEL